ncbi:MAG: XTP/dITP diphosphatase [Eubacteriales bacterium]|nr:XTP/dITP diphosphatase [Eubacteriales bacterium]
MADSIIFATRNNKKVEEINAILAGSGLNVISMEAAGIFIDVEEDGYTFEQNAIKKASTIMKLTGATVLADDSGLEVDYLNGAPGIYSARFGGRDTSYLVKNKLILDCLKDAKGKERSARFVCVIAASFPNGEVELTKGVMEGYIADRQMGRNGFGYDPIFYVPKYNCTSAQLEPKIKNQISHRAEALNQMKKILLERFQL